MKDQPDKIDLLKYWLDAEISLNHIYLAVIIIMLANNLVVTVLGVLYIIYNGLYSVTRIAYVAKHDPSYLKVPRPSK